MRREPTIQMPMDDADASRATNIAQRRSPLLLALTIGVEIFALAMIFTSRRDG